MKGLVKVAMIAAVFGLVGCNEEPAKQELSAQTKQELAEKNAKWLAEQQAKQAEYEASLPKDLRIRRLMQRDFPQWDVTIEKDQLTDRTNVYLGVNAKEFNGFYDDYPRLKMQHRPQLVIACENNKTVMYVDFKHMVADAVDGTRVTYRAGEQKAVSGYWDRSTDYKALGLWSGKKAIPALRKMAGEKEFIIQATPESGTIETAVFHIEGLNHAIELVKDECNWR